MRLFIGLHLLFFLQISFLGWLTKSVQLKGGRKVTSPLPLHVSGWDVLCFTLYHNIPKLLDYLSGCAFIFLGLSIGLHFHVSPCQWMGGEEESSLHDEWAGEKSGVLPRSQHMSMRASVETSRRDVFFSWGIFPQAVRHFRCVCALLGFEKIDSEGGLTCLLSYGIPPYQPHPAQS